MTASDGRQRKALLLASGFSAGMIVTGILNPVDRALYLTVAKRRRFFHPLNWQHPFQGLAQSIVQRAVSTGVWFPLERLFRECSWAHSCAKVSPGLVDVVSGQAAGMANAILMSPFAFVKYQTWGLPDGKRSFLRTARKILKTSGTATIFFRGLPATVVRDALFGGCFGWLRSDLRARGLGGYCSDFVAAGAATLLSAPANYARNIQYGANWKAPTPSGWGALRNLLMQAGRERTLVLQMFVIFHRTNVGWGTLRVAGGMALTSQLFTLLVTCGESFGV